MNRKKLPTSHFLLPAFLKESKGLKVALLFVVLLTSQLSHAQEKYKISEKDYNNAEVEMADVMRQNGKIYVVVGVIFIIFAGITYYLVRLDKKVSAIEKELKTEA